MQIPFSHDPVWFVVGAVQHSRECSTGLARLLPAIQKRKKRKVSKPRKKKKESHRKDNKWRIPFRCSLFSVSFKEQDVNRTDAATDMTFISYHCRNLAIYLSLRATWTQAVALLVLSENVRAHKMSCFRGVAECFLKVVNVSVTFFSAHKLNQPV